VFRSMVIRQKRIDAVGQRGVLECCACTGVPSAGRPAWNVGRNDERPRVGGSDRHLERLEVQAALAVTLRSTTS
jgi:hypothetical protein